jgi:hypothetical protein
MAAAASTALKLCLNAPGAMMIFIHRILPQIVIFSLGYRLKMVMT